MKEGEKEATAMKTATTPSTPSIPTAVSKPAASWRSTPWWRALRVILGIAAWALLMLSLLLSATVVGWIMLGVVLLGSGPAADVDTSPAVVLLALLALTGALAWVVARFF